MHIGRGEYLKTYQGNCRESFSGILKAAKKIIERAVVLRIETNIKDIQAVKIFPGMH